MYPHIKQQYRNHTQANIRQQTIMHPTYLLIAGLLLITTNNTQAETEITEGTARVQYDNFYQLLHKPTNSQYRPVYNYLLVQVAGDDSAFSNTEPDLISDQDLAFNYLWMQTYQSEKNYKQGGAALGKLVRIGVKALYRTYTGGIEYKNLNDDEITGPLSNMDYRLRLSSNKIKLGVKYQF